MNLILLAVLLIPLPICPIEMIEIESCIPVEPIFENCPNRDPDSPIDVIHASYTDGDRIDVIGWYVKDHAILVESVVLEYDYGLVVEDYAPFAFYSIKNTYLSGGDPNVLNGTPINGIIWCGTQSGFSGLPFWSR